MKAKKALVYRSAFSKPPISLKPKPLVQPEVAHIRVTKVKIAYVLMSLLVTKALRSDKINFRILCIIQDWDKV